MKAGHFRSLLAQNRPIVLAGAHDAISARIVERNGFDAVWVSSFGLSAAQKSMPDMNVLTMTEVLEVAKNINTAVRIPVIADCDNGYGNAINVMRTAEEFSSAGIAGISIEDATFPKRCSLYGGRHDLVSVEEMAGRVRAAKSAATTSDFVVIARTEALIAGLGLQEAMTRADSYTKAGADAILIHSKAKSSQEVLEFAKSWEGRVPLVVVPTMFPSASVEELSQAGFKIIIFANHALRAAVAAMNAQMKILHQEGRAEVLDGNIASLQEVYDLVGVPEFQARESEFIPSEQEAPGAVILAAGFEKQLLPLNEDKPKTLLEIKGRSILERQMHLLHSAGVHQISVCAGYRAETVKIPNIQLFENPHYESTGIAASLFSAEAALKGRLLVMYGDILFDRALLDRLLDSETDVGLVVDRAWYDLYRTEGQSPDGADLVTTEERPVTSHRFLPSPEPLHIRKIGQKLDKRQVTGEFIGLAYFSPLGVQWLKEAYAKGASTSGPYYEAPSFRQASLCDLLQAVIDQGHPVKAIETYKGWLEVDTFEDYRRAWAKL
ncbi:MAG: isocitrate lyase/phosphoenolpyruvate mutase family protein [Candidatus Omnitrophica bacterium]|nr:isocitrate lyase/phosphoenolpyruvate mutase family protein [Candidatus Omnitrophota bacterium]